jgi:hypothetical protein
MKRKNKLYLVEVLGVTGYDEFDGVVVCAKNKQEAIFIASDACYNYNGKELETTFIGHAKADMKAGVVLSSFNAA